MYHSFEQLFRYRTAESSVFFIVYASDRCWFCISENQQKTNSVNYRTVSQSVTNHQTKKQDSSSCFPGRVWGKIGLWDDNILTYRTKSETI